MSDRERDFNVAFGARLKALRKEQKIRQQRLAAKLGIHRNTLMRLEKCGTGCSAWMLLCLSEALSVHPTALLRDR